MAVIMIPIMLITWLLTSKPKEYEVKPVDWKPVLAQARAQAGWPVLAPQGLPESGEGAWVANIATWVAKGERGGNGEPSPRNQWELGMLSPDKIHFKLTQADLVDAEQLKQQTRQGVSEGTQPITQRTWEKFVSADGRTHFLVLREQASTTVLAADTDYLALQQYAGTLTDRG